MTRFALAADTVFDGADLHRDTAVVIEKELIRAVVPSVDLPAGLPAIRLPAGAWLAPGFIDLQVNGGGDVLFNDAPTAQGIAAIVAAHRRFGTTAMLPTLISDTRETMKAARRAAATAMRECPEVLGIHFEGPFLSPERAGIHDPQRLRVPDAEDLAFLTAPAPGVTLVTMAPERVPPGFIAALTRAGLRVALGHSAATYEETLAALDEGLTGFTHLFNAMPPLAARAPGPAAAALDAPGAWYGLIVDGFHVAPPMLRLALRGRGRAILVTDAMSPVGGTQRQFALQGRPIRLHEGRLTDANGRLAGSALDMASAVRNCVRLLDLPLPGALRLASAEPAAVLGLDGRLGRVKPGCRADLVALDPDKVEVLGCWVAGKGGLHAS
ncbi:MAG TPA: N-acetylglucosamine-6-phosphate deacetylase [Stellaceae bacterium]|nr:N-acetylglucosamine-6-phosphate deacetylase [Stellaceae bacterium]